MYKRKISNSQVVCLTLLWGLLCYLVLTYNNKIDFQVVFTLVASGIIIFVPIYKNRKQFNK